MRFGKFTPSHLPPPRTKGENKVSIVDFEGPKDKTARASRHVRKRDY